MEIEVEVRKVYGLPKIYPVNEAAKLLAELTGKKTLDLKDLEIARKLGHRVIETISPKLALRSAQC